MLNLAEHKILPANKEQITDKCRCFLLSQAEYEIFSAYEYEKCQLMLAFSYLSADKILCSAELSMKTRFITKGPELNQKTQQKFPLTPPAEK